ncbi:LytTR family two component transcriptional regulator [Pontibacter ummariensis]|uniref:Two component transcriptional regulator, LytTR family n=1 Tax=Pontibacter ummariensis TaxID=1610492 RepID=A0A239FYW2_9BACT|nr:LytTR family DNA-binding domain-containing protein [Pontibacter ummariensis]PRY11882.1 LytTR family two component transcriptional regulator [Pontibacter ummariensis]SNS61472.1 two component transcriptional regulator, LytTR family [Pontibacter ummariensis]
MNILIIEDEELAADVLTDIIEGLRPEAKILNSLSSVREAVRWLELNQEPDLIFCDIHLSDGNSFEIFRKVDVKCPVIFTTAYDQYAIDAFKVNSIDYLLKPIMEEEVAQALKKYESLQSRSTDNGYGNLQDLIQQSLPKQLGSRTRFLVKQGQTMITVTTEEVAFFQAEEGVVFLFTFEGKRYIINHTLDQLEEQLDTTKFFRVNRQFIVNIEVVQEIAPYFKGRLSLKLKPPFELEQVVSTYRATAFKQWLDS